VGVPMENLIYRIARKLVGIRKPFDHYHQAPHVDGLLKGNFVPLLSRNLPFSLLPDVLSLYLVSVYEKS
jgi:hypothetical protein